jgi:oligoendopeptidase F
MNATTLPRWDLAEIFPSVESPEFLTAFDAIKAKISELSRLFDALKISADSDAATDSAAYDAVTTAWNTLIEDLAPISSYLGLSVAIDSRDAAVQGMLSALKNEFVALSLLRTRYTAWLGTLDLAELTQNSKLATEHLFSVQQAQISAAHLMSSSEETLAAQLSLSGGSAWTRLHGDITSQLSVLLSGEPQPMSMVRAAASDPDRTVRQQAFAAELAGWKTVEVPIAAALNGIKYETRLLCEKRHWASPKEMCCFSNSIDVATLDAMLAAARASFPDFRRYFKAKAKQISNNDALAWCDLLAPVGKETSSWTWPEATAFIEAQFDSFSPKLGDFARHAFQNTWIDAEPRPGKRDGAFCMSVGSGSSRILQNYRPSFDAVSTLAHELGHGYHNLCLKQRTPLQRSTPMTLAETASIFCETIIKNAALARTNIASERLAILEASLQNSSQVVIDIYSRYLFETSVFEQRQHKELSPDEFCELMRKAQQETYGDGLDQTTLHQYMWAVKGHYYGSTYYNFPYMFGLLFGLGLYAIYEKDPEIFKARYDLLLSKTGMADAPTLAADFGFDLRDQAFWTASLDIVRTEIDQFCAA